MLTLIALSALLLPHPAVSGEIRSDHPCVLAAVRTALVQAAQDTVALGDSESLELGLNLDVASQYSTRFESYRPEKSTYVVAIDARLGVTKRLVYEVKVEGSDDEKSCKAVSIVKAS